jgi:uncharacterized protein (TIGR03000 family)
MIRQAFSFGGLLLLAGAAALATPSPGQAQHGGGGHGGGGHAGGFHGGGFHPGGVHPGGFRPGGFRPGGVPGGFRPGGIHGAFGVGRPGFGFRPFVGGGYYPYYGSYGYGSPYYTDPNGESDLPYDPGYSNPYGGMTPDTTGGTTSAAPSAGNSQSLYLPETAAAQADPLAHVTVRLPADARLWFQDTPTANTGPVREFNSPPLTPGGRYTYDVRATWTENGREVTQTQRIGVTAGAYVDVDFPVQPGATGQPSVPSTR